MNVKTKTIFMMLLLAALAAGGALAHNCHGEAADVEPTPDEKVAGLEQMCAEAQTAMAARQAETTLFERVGGRDGLQVVVKDTVQRHLENEQIKHLLKGVDTDRLVQHVTDFLVVGTGGEGEYYGRNMVDAHAHLALTNADFLAAGGDLGAAMQSARWGEGEQQELLCAFVALRGEVVTR